MKKLLTPLLLLSLIVPSTAFASVQIFIGRTIQGITAGNYIYLNSVFNSGTGPSVPWPISGTFSNLHAYTDTTQAAGVGFAVQINDTGNKSLACSLVGSVTSCSDTTHVYVPTATTSNMSIRATTVGAPVNATIYYTVEFTPSTSNETAILSSSLTTNVFATGDQFIPYDVEQAPGSTEASMYTPAPEAGTLDKFSQSAGSPGAGKSYTYVLRQNSASTTLTCTIANSATDCNDFIHAITISKGDTLDFSDDPVGTPSARGEHFSDRFVPSVPGDFDLFGKTATNDPNNATAWIPMAGSPNTTAIEASTTEYADASQVKGFSVVLATATGAAKSRTFTLRKNNADTSCSVTITNGTAGSTTCSPAVPFAVGDTWDYSDVPTGTPAASIVSIGTVLVATTFPKHHVWSGFFHLLGGFFKIK